MEAGRPLDRQRRYSLGLRDQRQQQQIRHPGLSRDGAAELSRVGSARNQSRGLHLERPQPRNRSKESSSRARNLLRLQRRPRSRLLRRRGPLLRSQLFIEGAIEAITNDNYQRRSAVLRAWRRRRRGGTGSVGRQTVRSGQSSADLDQPAGIRGAVAASQGCPVAPSGFCRTRSSRLIRTSSTSVVRKRFGDIQTSLDLLAYPVAQPVHVHPRELLRMAGTRASLQRDGTGHVIGLLQRRRCVDPSTIPPNGPFPTSARQQNGQLAASPASSTAVVRQR